MNDWVDEFVSEDGVMSEDGKSYIVRAFDILAAASFRNSKAHGWYEKYITTVITDHDYGTTEEVLGERNFGEVIALITSELSEAFESYRDGEPVLWYRDSLGGQSEDAYGIDDVPNKAEGVAAEFADVLIRMFDYVGAYPMPLADALIQKHEYNLSRPYRHGGKRA